MSEDAAQMAERLVDVIRTGSPWAVTLLLAVMPAVCEELLFRGWMLSGLAGGSPGRRRAASAILVQAAAFAAFHLMPERMPQTFALGIVAGVLTLATRSLLPAIVMHLAHNATPVLVVATAAPAEIEAVLETSRGLPAWIVWLGVGCLACGGLLVAAACQGRRERDAWTASGNDSSLS